MIPQRIPRSDPDLASKVWAQSPKQFDQRPPIHKSMRTVERIAKFRFLGQPEGVIHSRQHVFRTDLWVALSRLCT